MQTGGAVSPAAAPAVAPSGGIIGAPAGEPFAEAIAMLARLPLSDAERAEAGRRMLLAS